MRSCRSPAPVRGTGLSGSAAAGLPGLSSRVSLASTSMLLAQSDSGARLRPDVSSRALGSSRRWAWAGGRTRAVGRGGSQVASGAGSGRIWFAMRAKALVVAASSVWRAQTPGPKGGGFSAVSCRSASFCMAVGAWYRSQEDPIALAERWNGSRWSRLPTPRPPGSTGAQLLGVSCVSPVACMAVGFSRVENGFLDVALTERWDGSSWSVVPARNVPALQNDLFGVSCSAVTACTAVGRAETPHALLIERWNGSRWSIQRVSRAVGKVSRFSGYLSGVSCSGRRACTAVGSLDPVSGSFSGPPGWLVLQWNGRSWSMPPSPRSLVHSARASELGAVSCPLARACMAVGAAGVSSGSFTGEAVEWNGIRWSVKRQPLVAADYGLSGVSCTSATACTAVGSGGSGTTPVERWNGLKWSLQSVPAPSSGSVGPVSCTSRTACVAVGTGGNRPLAWIRS